MSLKAEVLDALLAAGATAEMIVAAVKADMRESEEARERRREGNAERQRRFKAKKKAGNGSNALPAVTPPIEDNHTPQPVSNETVLADQPKAKSGKGTRLADDFEPPADWIDWAVKKRGWSRAEATEECECFARYWQAKPGREACKLDWPKTWQNWVANSRRQTSGNGSTGPPVSHWEHYKRQQEREQRRASAG